jgi:hypothetical protein
MIRGKIILSASILLLKLHTFGSRKHVTQNISQIQTQNYVNVLQNAYLQKKG